MRGFVSLELKRISEIIDRLKRIGLVDVHAHGFLNDSLNSDLLRTIDMFNVKKVFLSIYPFDLGDLNPSHEDVLKGNMKIFELSKRDKRIGCMVFANLLNPEDIDMVEEFLREGCLGIGEIYRSVKPKPAIIKPLIEIAVEYDVPILIHVANRLYPRDRPREASVTDLCSIARKWPKAKIIVSHIGGGGDWENTIEILDMCKRRNLYIDTGGSVGDYGMIDMLVKRFDYRNILFGSDNIYTTSIARIEYSDLSEEIKEMIYRENPCKVFSCD
ncbi:MAG: amidohydrolase family protein [Sulfolobales archaeon]